MRKLKKLWNLSQVILAWNFGYRSSRRNNWRSYSCGTGYNYNYGSNDNNNCTNNYYVTNNDNQFAKCCRVNNNHASFGFNFYFDLSLFKELMNFHPNLKSTPTSAGLDIAYNDRWHFWSIKRKN